MGPNEHAKYDEPRVRVRAHSGGAREKAQRAALCQQRAGVPNSSTRCPLDMTLIALERAHQALSIGICWTV